MYVVIKAVNVFMSTFIKVTMACLESLILLTLKLEEGRRNFGKCHLAFHLPFPSVFLWDEAFLNGGIGVLLFPTLPMGGKFVIA